MIFKCRMCDKEVDLPVTQEQLREWRDGELIQNVFPHFSSSDREIMITNICGTCYDELFADEEEDADEPYNNKEDDKS